MFGDFENMNSWIDPYKYLNSVPVEELKDYIDNIDPEVLKKLYFDLHQKAWNMLEFINHHGLYEEYRNWIKLGATIGLSQDSLICAEKMKKLHKIFNEIKSDRDID